MNKGKYILNLTEQYKAATGTDNIDLDSFHFVAEFNEWLRKRRTNGDEILKLLDNVGLEIDTPQVAEIGKGKYDSIVYPYDTTIITPYYKSFDTNRPSEGKILDIDFQVINSVPTLITSDNNIPNIQDISPSEILTYMIHNPYNEDSIKDLIKLHNNPNNGIIFCIYGKLYDKDRNAKLKLLEELKNQAVNYDTWIETEAKGGDNYWHILATDMVAKRKKLIRK